MPASPALEARTRELASELDEVFDGITSCRVSVEAPHRHHHQGQLYRVCVDVHVPGAQIVVGRSPDDDRTHEDPYVTLHDAFRAAKRQLKRYARRLHEHVPRSLGAKAPLEQGWDVAPALLRFRA